MLRLRNRSRAPGVQECTAAVEPRSDAFPSQGLNWKVLRVVPKRPAYRCTDYIVYIAPHRDGASRGVGDDHRVPQLAQHAAHPREVSVRFKRQARSRLRSPGALHGRGNRPVVSPLGTLLDLHSILASDVKAELVAVNKRIFNLVYNNFRISEVALRVRDALKAVGVSADIHSDYSYNGVRNYRVSGQKLERALNFRPAISIEESVQTMVQEIRRYNHGEFDNPRYCIIHWTRLLEEALVMLWRTRLNPGRDANAATLSAVPVMKLSMARNSQRWEPMKARPGCHQGAHRADDSIGAWYA